MLVRPYNVDTASVAEMVNQITTHLVLVEEIDPISRVPSCTERCDQEVAQHGTIGFNQRSCFQHCHREWNR